MPDEPVEQPDTSESTDDVSQIEQIEGEGIMSWTVGQKVWVAGLILGTVAVAGVAAVSFASDSDEATEGAVGPTSSTSTTIAEVSDDVVPVDGPLMGDTWTMTVTHFKGLTGQEEFQSNATLIFKFDATQSFDADMPIYEVTSGEFIVQGFDFETPDGCHFEGPTKSFQLGPEEFGASIPFLIFDLTTDPITYDVVAAIGDIDYYSLVECNSVSSQSERYRGTTTLANSFEGTTDIKNLEGLVGANQDEVVLVGEWGFPRGDVGFSTSTWEITNQG
jgi:hypothetical protein